MCSGDSCHGSFLPWTLANPHPINEPVRSYAPGTADRASLKAARRAMASEQVEMPAIIGGREIRIGRHRHVGDAPRSGHVTGIWHRATPALVQEAIETSLHAHAEWSQWSLTTAPPCFSRLRSCP